MRVALLAAVIFISACASDGLRLAPPSGVDFSGHWKLNPADSDDPMHLLQIANAQATGGSDSGNSGRGGRGGRGGQTAGGYTASIPPATPSENRKNYEGRGVKTKKLDKFNFKRGILDRTIYKIYVKKESC